MLLNRGIQPALMGKVIATFPHAHALSQWAVEGVAQGEEPGECSGKA